MNFFLLRPEAATSLKTFIKEWSRCYEYVCDEQLYTDHIGKDMLDAKAIEELLQWKNRNKINGHKYKAPLQEKIIAGLPYINRLKKHFDMELFDDKFGSIGAIWQIFLLHIIAPSRFPIFDQHVYRAHLYLVSGKLVTDVSMTNERKMTYYFDQYLPFYIKNSKGIKDRELDKALWSFGKLLRTKYGRVLIDDLNKAW